MKIVNICGSGSSGTTVLSHILNKHPKIASGDELELFSKGILYSNFKKVKRMRSLIRLLGVSDNPFTSSRCILTNVQSYGMSDEMVWEKVAKSNSIEDLASIFYSHIITKTGKEIWAEKTPRNIFQIGKFLANFPKGKVIHLVRDPKDVIISLSKRGDYKHHKYSSLKAAERWLTSVASIQPFRKNERVIEVIMRI